MNTNNLFTITQLAKACNTSRATLLRLEEAGLLHPSYVNPENGYRYYEINNVFRVARILSYQDFGLTQKELSEINFSENPKELIIQKLERKLKFMEEYITNLRIYTGQGTHLELSAYEIPELYCYKKVYKNIKDQTLVRGYLWKTFNEMVAKGYSINRNKPPFVSVQLNNMYNNNFKEQEYDYTVYIPVIPSKNFNEEIEVLSACSTISVLLKGGSGDIIVAFQKLLKYASDNNLSLTGEARILSIIVAYPGENIPEETWVSRVCVPLK